MKTLIVYASKNGASAEACEMLRERLSSFSEVDLCDVHYSLPSPDGYDVLVVGGSIRMNKLSRALKKYISANAKTISSMPSAAFICCGLTNDFDDYVTTEIPRSAKFSLGVHCFGGQLKPERAKGLDKPIIFMMRQSILTQDPDKSDSERRELPELFPDTIYALAEKIKKLKTL